MIEKSKVLEKEEISKIQDLKDRLKKLQKFQELLKYKIITSK